MKALQEMFESHQLTIVTMGGTPWLIAQQVGQLLGYGGDGAALVTVIRRDWKLEMHERKHYVILKGIQLRDLKALFELNKKSSSSRMAPPFGSRTKELMLLSEAGLDKVALLTKKPLGIRLRDWLVDEIMPKMRRGEIVPVEQAQELAQSNGSNGALTREDKLSQLRAENRRENRKLRLEEKKLELEEKRLELEREVFLEETRFKIHKESMSYLRSVQTNEGMNERQRLAFQATVMEKLTGDQFKNILRRPDLSTWMSASTMATKWKTSPANIGTMARRAQVYGDPNVHWTEPSMASNGGGFVTQKHYYHPSAQNKIYEELQKQRDARKSPAQKKKDQKEAPPKI